LRLVHLADLHLGYRQYQRLTPGGINQREADVARTFELAVDRVIELAPEIVIVAGDVFHSVRPSNPAILHAFIHFSRLVQALPATRVVIIAGNHDVPRSAETGSILKLFSRIGKDFSELRIDVVDREPQRIAMPEYDLSVLAVPDVPGIRPIFNVDPEFKYNVLALHGEIEGVLPMTGATPERAAMVIPVKDLRATDWSYVALGHYHVFREIEPNAFYAGSTDYTSTNTWGELNEQRVGRIDGKGFIEWHFETSTALFRSLPPSRGFVDLPPISADGKSVAEIDEQIRQHVESFPDGIDDRVVRLRLHDMQRHLVRELDHKAIREYKRRALNFFLDVRRPDVIRRVASGAAGRRPSLDEVLRESLSTRLLPGDVDRDRLVALGAKYLGAADAIATTVAQPEA
jgi:DNA repair exonuclease SbcCD nuclease subunit